MMECPGDQMCIAGTCTLGGQEDAPLRDDAPRDGGDPSDGPVLPDAPLGAWSTPTLVQGVNTTGGETDPSFTADRLTIVFSSDRAGDDDIWIGARNSVADPFFVTRLDAVDATPDDEKSPEISPDGNTLFFTSIRGTTSYDIYVSTKTSGIWSAPMKVSELSTSSTEEDVAITQDGLTAVFNRGSRFKRSTRSSIGAAWSAPVDLQGSFGTNPASPAFDGAGNLYFQATSSDRDLYYARSNGTAFDPPAKIIELSTSTRDAAPFVSADGRYMMFEHDRDLYETTR